MLLTLIKKVLGFVRDCHPHFKHLRKNANHNITSPNYYLVTDRNYSYKVEYKNNSNSKSHTKLFYLCVQL